MKVMVLAAFQLIKLIMQMFYKSCIWFAPAVTVLLWPEWTRAIPVPECPCGAPQTWDSSPQLPAQPGLSQLLTEEQNAPEFPAEATQLSSDCHLFLIMQL